MAKYRFGTRLGSGGFAEVLECTRVDDGAQFAAKRLLSRDPEHVKRFSREVRMQATLSHPNIVPIIARNLTVTPPWVVLPRAECNMRELLAGRSGEEFVWTVMEASTGLMHAHSNGVIHRDLKPDNILAFKEKGRGHRMCVADFGLGRFIDRDSTEITLVNMGLGTIAYMAPEQFTDARSVDVRADVYAMGKILFQVLTGLTPYPTMDLAKIPMQYRYVVQKATHADRQRRYQSIDDFVKDLDIASNQPEQFSKPTERIAELLSTLNTEKKISSEDAERLVKIFIENLDDTTVLLTDLPKLSTQTLKSLFTECPEAMDEVISAYDAEVADGISFSYCDTAADFYERLWSVCASDKIRAMIVIRLAHMGPNNNRWHVGGVLRTIVARADGADPALRALRDELRAHPEIRKFNRNYLDNASVPPILKEVLSE